MNVKLTKRTAWELISRICPRLNISKDTTPPDVAIFRASTGPAGLEIRCENDWFNHNGRIRLTLSDGENQIIQYYHPRHPEPGLCGGAGRKRRIRKRIPERLGSVNGLGMAHKLVDRYWEG